MSVVRKICYAEIMKDCFMISSLKVAVVYVWPAGGVHWDQNAIMFAASYAVNPPGYPHDLYIVTNGSIDDGKLKQTFDGIPHKLFSHDNSGWDIGAFQHAAASIPCDLMVFFGNTAYIKRPGWLDRMISAYLKFGPGLYGTMGHRGDHRFDVAPHIRTTGFWMPRDLFNAYPFKVTRKEQRYQFEHGPNCLTSWVCQMGLKVWVVTWTGEFGMAQWDSIPNGYHRGDQSDLLAGDRMTRPPFYPVP